MEGDRDIQHKDREVEEDEVKEDNNMRSRNDRTARETQLILRDHLIMEEEITSRTPVGRELYITTKERLHDLFPRTVVTLNLRITTNVIMIVHINLKEAAEFATHMGTGPIEQRGLGPSTRSQAAK